MKINDTQHELIDAYVQQQLKGSALKSFELELIQNETIRQEVLFRQGIRSAFQVKAVEQVIQQAKSDPLLEEANERKIKHPQLESVHSTIQQARLENDIRKKRTIRRLVAIGIAASVLIMGWVGLIPIIAIQHLLANAEQAYKDEQYNNTLAIFDDLRTQYSYETDEILLYEGIIYYHKNEYNKATETLQQIIKRNAKIKAEAHWYLALVYLKNEQKDPAKEQLEILVNQTSKYQKNAQTLLNKLN